MSSTIKKYLEIAAIWPHCLSGRMTLQITAKYFNLQSQQSSVTALNWKYSLNCWWQIWQNSDLLDWKNSVHAIRTGY